MISVQNRPLDVGQRVHVYYNLHQGGYSIKDKKTGLVAAYAQNVLITDCKFKVQEAGRLRTIAEKRKRVHAYIEGTFRGADIDHDLSRMTKVYYNPYVTEQFTDIRSGDWVLSADRVFCTDKICYIE